MKFNKYTICFKHLILSGFFVTIISACGGGGGSSTTQPKGNFAPTANANTDQSVNEQTLVTLSGSGSDSDGSIASYRWLQKDGTNVSLSNADSATAHFDAPVTTEELTLTFELTVTDNGGASHSDTVNIKVNPVNAKPVADAGEDENIRVSEQVQLTGSGTDTDGTIVSYQWAQLSGTAALLTNTDTANLTFTAPDVYTEEILEFELIVTDNEGETASDTINITVTSILVTEVLVEITDANFASCLSEQTVKYANEVISIICSERTISNVNGLEYFKLLQHLNLSQNYYLSTVDVSANTELRYLDLFYNINQKNIDLSNNHELEILNLGYAIGTSLDISNNPKLKELYLVNDELEEIDLSNNPDIIDLTLDVYQMTTLDLSANPNLSSLYIYGEELTDINISNSTMLTTLSLSGDKLNAPDLSKHTRLVSLSLDSESLCDINFYDNVGLEELFLSNWFCDKPLDISTLTNLVKFHFVSGNLDALDLSSNVKLYAIAILSAQLTNLDLTNNIELYYLLIYSTHLTKIDTSQNTKLVFLYLNNNRLTNIDVSNNNLLVDLYLEKNLLTSAPIGISEIDNTSATISLRYNQLTDAAKAELEILKETYNNIYY